MNYFAFLFLLFTSFSILYAQTDSNMPTKQLDSLHGENFIKAVIELFEKSNKIRIKSFKYPKEYLTYLDKAKIYNDKVKNKELSLIIDYWCFKYYGNHHNFKEALTIGRLLLNKKNSYDPKYYYDILENMSNL